VPDATATPIEDDAFVVQLRRGRELARTDHQRAWLDVLIEHAIAENVTHDIDRLMATMVDEPNHEFYGLPRVPHLVGQDAVRGYYLRTFTDAGPGRGSMQVERLVVGDDAVVVVGAVLYSGAGLSVRAPEVARQLDLSRPCVLRKQMCLVMPFDGNRIIAEQHYFDGPFTVEDISYL
jgi:hypothetical protein